MGQGNDTIWVARRLIMNALIPLYGINSELQLAGWSRKRRVVVMRRRRSLHKDVELLAQAAEGDPSFRIVSRGSYTM